MKDTISTRAKAGKIAGIAAIVLNLILAALKIACGVIAGLISLVADGINNLSDCGSGAVTLVSFRIAARPADKEHPYGHRRAEYVASLVISFLILFLGAELFITSVRSVFAENATVGSPWIYAVIGVSVAVKAGMGGGFMLLSKKISSDTVRATAIDCFCDCLASIAVLIGVVIGEATGFPADGYAGGVVALFILWEGYRLSREAGSKLLGRAPDPAVFSQLRTELLKEAHILGVHDLKVYPYGPDTYFATVHVEMDARIPSLEAHEVLDGLERSVREAFGISLTAHLDPVDLSDGETQELEGRIRAAAEGMVEGLNLHDFRLIRGTTKKLIFEAGIPFDCKKSDAEIANDLERFVHVLGDYEVCITVERE